MSPGVNELPSALAAGTVVAGRYRIERLLGHGGSGAVYAAVHLPSGQTVAVKTLLPGLPQVDEIIARFRREALAANLLSHPSIVEMLDLGPLGDDSLYMAMELVPGRSLRELLDDGPLPPQRALLIARQVLEGLGHAHAHGLVHRDLKPENLMLTADADAPGGERVKILDFGLVKLVGDAALGAERLTRTGVVFGTPAYMAPEQALGRAVDARVDLYALGVIIFEMMAGRRPFTAKDPVALMTQHLRDSVPDLASIVGAQPWQTPALGALLGKSLEKKREHRFADAADMLSAVDGWARS